MQCVKLTRNKTLWHSSFWRWQSMVRPDLAVVQLFFSHFCSCQCVCRSNKLNKLNKLTGLPSWAWMEYWFCSVVSALYREWKEVYSSLLRKINSFYEHLWVEFYADINFKIFEGKSRHTTTRLYTEYIFWKISNSINNCQTTTKVTVTLHHLQGWVEVSVIPNCHQH